MKLKNFLLLFMTLSVSVLLVGCSKVETNSLQGTAWLLIGINGTQPLNETLITIEFSEGQISGSAGCNHFGGDYKVKGEQIEFISIYNTEMYCMEPEGLMEQEQFYLEILGAAVRFNHAEGELVIFDNTDRKLEFDPYDSNVVDVSSGDPNEPVVIEAPTEIPEVEATINEGPPWESHLYQDPETGISVFIPEEWIVTGIVEGQYAIFQSYPEDKYIGGEAFEEGDTKCDLNIQPVGMTAEDLVTQWQANSMTTIVSEKDFTMQSGRVGQRFVTDNMGRSTVFLTEIEHRVVLLTCFGDFTMIDEIASTLTQLN